MTDTSYTPPPVPSTSRWNTGGAGPDWVETAGAGRFAQNARASFTRDAANTRDTLVGGFNKVLDAIEPHLDRAPSNLQPAARKAIAFSRERPLATMAGLAALALMFAGGSRRR